MKRYSVHNRKKLQNGSKNLRWSKNRKIKSSQKTSEKHLPNTKRYHSQKRSLYNPPVQSQDSLARSQLKTLTKLKISSLSPRDASLTKVSWPSNQKVTRAGIRMRKQSSNTCRICSRRTRRYSGRRGYRRMMSKSFSSLTTRRTSSCSLKNNHPTLQYEWDASLRNRRRLG